MAEFPALPLWTDAYLGDTTHLTTLEHGAYLLLLMTAWRTSENALPDDDRLLARYARLDSRQWKRIKPIIADFFTIDGGQWRQRRLDDERESIEAKREKAAENGRASARKRQGRHAANKGGTRQDGKKQSPKTNARSEEAKPLENNNPRSTEREQSDNEASTDDQQSVNLTISNNKPLLSPLEESQAKRPLPDDFEPLQFEEGTQSRKIVDGWSRLEFERQLERFKSHHGAAGSRFKNWQKAWSTWVLNSVDFAPRARGYDQSPGGSDSLVDRLYDEAQRRKAAAG